VIGPVDLAYGDPPPTVLREPGVGLLGIAVAPAGLRLGVDDHVAWLLVEGGTGSLRIDGAEHHVDGRPDVFAGVGISALLGPGSTAEADPSLRCVVAWRAGNPLTAPVTTRVIDPAEVAVEERGRAPYARTVRTYLPRGPLIAGETVNPAGGWSSYPPHRHEHEEAYLYRFQPPGGFGLAARYDAGDAESAVVRDGDLTWIPHGYHPVVAAPGYAMTYIWALAGPGEELRPELDPAHAWVDA
jgi:5-deoxy-glucuronate isomerase